MISFKENFEFSPWGQSLQTISCIATMAIYILLPAYVYFKSMKEFKVLKSKEMKQSIGAFYEDKDIRRGKKVLLHPMSFLARRLVLVWLVVDGPQDLVFQMMIMMSSSILSIAVLYATEAQLSTGKRRMSVFNESVVLHLSYCFLSFDTLEVEANFSVGYVPIASVGLYILVCLLLVIFQSYKAIRRSLRVYCAKRYQRKQRKVL